MGEYNLQFTVKRGGGGKLPRFGSNIAFSF
jgi:hypothetical protein